MKTIEIQLTPEQTEALRPFWDDIVGANLRGELAVTLGQLFQPPGGDMRFSLAKFTVVTGSAANDLCAVMDRHWQRTRKPQEVQP